MKQTFPSLFGLLFISPIQAWAYPNSAPQRLPESKRAVDLAYDGTRGLQWNGPIFKGQDNYTLYGDAKSIHDQILAKNPAYRVSDFEAPIKHHRRSAQIKVPTPNCDVFTFANPKGIENGIGYLEAIGGTCFVRAGPQQCIRTSCEEDAGIYLCNDNSFPLKTIQCATVANYAFDISQQCGQQSGVRGQEFDTNNWNVVVSGNGCGVPPEQNPF